MGLQQTVDCKMPGLTCCEYRVQTNIPADTVMRVEVWCKGFRYDLDNILEPAICKCEEGENR